MTLENLHCPQFVDFTNHATFDIYDGADVFFEKAVAGEEFDLGCFDNTSSAMSGGGGNSSHTGNYEELSMTTTTTTTTSVPQPQKTSNLETSGNNCTTDTTPKTLSTTTTTTKATQMIMLNKQGSVHKPKQTKTSNYRQRTNSASSQRSVNTNNTSIANKSVKTSNQNIVKKTLAKVTAAFKPATSNTQMKICSTSNGNAAKKTGPMKVSHNLNASHASSTSKSNRRCSSVPRNIGASLQQPSAPPQTHKQPVAQKQETSKHPPLPKSQISLGEKIHNFFSRDKVTTTTGSSASGVAVISSSKNMTRHTPAHETANRVRSNSRENKPPTHGPVVTPGYVARSNSACTRKPIGDGTGAATMAIASQLKQHSSQNRSLLAPSLSAQKPQAQQQQQRVLPASLTDPKSPNFLYKPRQKSAERKENVSAMPYKGLKFLPNLNQHKPLQSLEPVTNIEERLKDAIARKDEKLKKLQDTEMNKVNPLIPTIDDTKKILQAPVRLNSSLNKHNKENTDSAAVKSMNLSTLSTSSKCSGGANTSRPMLLHTEQRAQQRQQYDEYLKQKERMADLIRKNLEMQKLLEDKEDIKNLRQQLQFKSRPFKCTKPMEIKPSEKPLTEPKTPPFKSLSINSTHVISQTNISQDNLN